MNVCFPAVMSGMERRRGKKKEDTKSLNNKNPINGHSKISYFKDIYTWTPSVHERRQSQAFQRAQSDRSRNIKIAARLFIFATMNVCFVLPCVFVFMALEGPASMAHKEMLYSEYRMLWLSRNMSRENVERLVRLQELACKNLQGWTYRHSLHLAYSIITTIGFGELAPVTELGKVVTIVYGTLGIVINILCLACLRVALGMSIYKLVWWYAKLKQGITRQIRSSIKVTFTLTLILLLWTITSVFTYSRGQTSLFVSWYNTFIAVTTIGFGDMVILDDFNKYLNDNLNFEQNIFLENFFQFLFMMAIILILALFSTLFEIIKQTNVRRVSKRVSHIVNIIHQTHTQGMNPILGVGRQSAVGSIVDVMPTIIENKNESTDEESDCYFLEEEDEPDNNDYDEVADAFGSV